MEMEMAVWENREAEARRSYDEHVLETEKAKTELAAINESLNIVRQQADESVE